ncbi:MAG TPA: GspH/FimT family pseudopilin [Gemmatimonadaceae bacterium]|nr:GspH/FimT family pseudopilin [Gemmatimonadaceae bacterium]
MVRSRIWRRAARGGVTLIEMLVVLTLIGIVAGMALPHVNVTKYRMDAAARLVASTLQTAQRLAVTRQYDVVVSFDQENQRLRMLEDANNNDVADAGERTIWRPLEEGAHFAEPPVRISAGGSGAVSGSRLRLVDGMESVVFRRSGAASSDLEVYVTSTRDEENDVRGATVVQATGRTEWFRLIGGTWKQGGA